MFRREKPQKGRYRQFHQLSVEALGFAEPEIDAELIALSARLWKKLGITSVTLELNSIGTAEARAGYKKVLAEYFGAHRDALDEDSLRRLERNPLRILDSKNPALRELIDARAAARRLSRRRVARALRARAAAARRRRRRVHAEPAARARPRLLLAHRVRVGHRPARRAERRLRGRPLRRPRRAARRPRHAGRRLGARASSGSSSSRAPMARTAPSRPSTRSSSRPATRRAASGSRWSRNCATAVPGLKIAHRLAGRGLQGPAAARGQERSAVRVDRRGRPRSPRAESASSRCAPTSRSSSCPPRSAPTCSARRART